MSRSGYVDDMDETWQLIMWRGAVKSAIRGKRGQAFLKEMLAAMDALPQPKLVSQNLEKDDAVCAIGSVGKVRGVDMTKIDPEDYARVAKAFGVSKALAREVMWANDEGGRYQETDGERFARMRAWIVNRIRDNASVTTALKGE